MGEEVLVKKRRVTGRDSMTLVWVSKNNIAPELSQIQSFSSHHDLEKCNMDKSTQAAQLFTHYKCIALNVKPVLLSDRSTPDA